MENLQLLGVMVHEHELHVHGLKHNHFFSSLFTFSVKNKNKIKHDIKIQCKYKIQTN
jgi:hypothetical protein